MHSAPAATQLTRSQFGRHVRRALADLHDPIALRRSPLRKLVVADDARDPAAALRECLTRAIETLQPGPLAHTDARAWRPYRVLLLRYLEARTAVEVERALALSTSQYYREHQSALEALTTLLFDRAADHPVAPRGSDTPADVASQDPRHNLPSQITSFLGREQELAQVNALLARTRLLTLSGAGGCGKTRLAIEAALCQLEHFQDGVWLVDLTPLAEPGLVAQTVALILGISEGPGEAIVSGLARGIGSKKLLVALDNCEHLLQACAQLIDALLRACPNLTILVTSRELVGITGETLFQVPPLRVPDHSPFQQPPSELMEYAAVELFVERAAAVAPGFSLTDQNADAIVQICSRLDGLPLAIELAAARVNVLSPHQIAERLTDRFRLLTAGRRAVPRHHQTLRALVDWSYELLAPDEQQLFERLAVFAGGWTLPAAETVCGGNGLEAGAVVELLAALVERSLVVAEPVDNGMRYRMLETLREYAGERLSRGANSRAVYERHTGYYTGLAEQLERMTYSPGGLTALQQFELEHNNFRVVLSNAARDKTAARMAASVAASLALLWFIRNFFTEARHWLNWVLSLEGVDDDPSSATRCLALAGFFEASMGDRAGGIEMCNAAVAAAERQGDPRLRAFVYFYRCGTEFVTGNAMGTEQDARIGIAACVNVDWAWGAATCNGWLGRSLLMQGKRAEALAELRTALDRSRAVGDPISAALTLSFYGVAVGAEGDYTTAASCLAEAIGLFRTLGSFAQMSRCLVDWAVLALANAKVEDAVAALVEGLEMTSRLGRVPYRLAQLLAGTAQVARARQRWLDAARLLACAQEIRTRSGTQLPPERARDEEALLDALRQHLGTTELATLSGEAHRIDEAAAVGIAMQVLAETGNEASRDRPPTGRSCATVTESSSARHR